MKLELVTRKEVSYVELQKDNRNSLGFTISDGTQIDLRPVVKNVKRNSPAAKSFVIAKGDVILSVNGCSTAGVKTKYVRRMLDDAGSNVNLQLLYQTQDIRILGCNVYREQRMTLKLQKKNGDFGFLVRKCSKYSFTMEYPVISNIKEGSLIHKTGHLQEGDRLLMINHVNLSWLPLSYIAKLLQENDNMEFTFEYSIGVVNFAEMKTKLDLEIDVPVAELGISIRTCGEECPVMYVGSIHQGSVAERCGVFSIGDIIISINDIDAASLTVSKAEFLFKNLEKVHKISLVSNSQKQVDAPSEISVPSTSVETISKESISSTTETMDRKLVNTPVSSNSAFPVPQKYNFQNLSYAEQIKSMDKFQNILPLMLSLKETLSTLTREAFGGRQTTRNENCASCNDADHAIKLCTSCLGSMNVKSAQSMDVLRDLIAHFVRFSTNGFGENDHEQFEVSLRYVIHILRETLPNILRIPGLQECCTILAEKISYADISCSTCEFEVKTVMMIAQQLQLVLSVKDDSVEYTNLIEHLVGCLLDMKFTCRESKCICSSNSTEKDNYSSENLPECISNGIEDGLSLNSVSTHIKNNSKTESYANRGSIESNLNMPQLKTCLNYDYFTLTHIQSVSESNKSSSLNTHFESSSINGCHIENNATHTKENVIKTSSTSVVSEVMTANHVKKLFKSMKPPKDWKSLGSLIRPKRPSKNKESTQDTRQSVSDSNKITDSNEASQNSSRITNDQSKTTVSSSINQNSSSSVFEQGKSSDASKVIQNGNSSFKQYVNTEPTKARQNGRYPLDGQNKNTISSRVKLPDGSNSFKKFHKHSSPVHIASQNEESIFNFNGDSTLSSSRCLSRPRNSLGAKKTHSETMKVTLTSKDSGFGLDISKESASELPLINAIEPGSPAQNVGVLKIGDRILAINRTNTSQLSTKQLLALKKEALAADTLALTIEFDIIDEEFQFGSFDVVLDRSLKIGLMFEDMKKGSPMIVSGILKGSGAHRCGQLFPRDEITFFKSMKNEEFDPISANYNREDNIIMTVLREPHKVLGLKEKSVNSSPGYVNPCLHHQDSVSSNGQNPILKKTSVRSLSGKGTLVVEQEVTLHRDKKNFDFGILLGEDEDTGRIYVSDMRPNGPACKSNVIKKFDRILKVNGVLVGKDEKNNVIQLLSQTNQTVDLLIRRIYREELSGI